MMAQKAFCTYLSSVSVFFGEQTGAGIDNVCFVSFPFLMHSGFEAVKMKTHKHKKNEVSLKFRAFSPKRISFGGFDFNLNLLFPIQRTLVHTAIHM